MASRLLRVCGGLWALRPPRASLQALARGLAVGGVPSDEEQATGLEREILEAAKKGKDPYHTLPPKYYSGTKEDPHLVPSTFDKRLVACKCDEDACLSWFWVHKGKLERCPSCGTYCKLVPHEFLQSAGH
uniref:Cytochrome c oxidase subunit 5B n=1 Tax=Pelusios castaneus TaxID=367368 RepID=A0A8C8RI46_9SAUR